jgi:hypothetical protein
MMGKSLRAAFVALALCVALHAQRPYVPYKVMLRATITHKAGYATVKAASVSTLYDAIQAVAQEYGWAVDYEEPPYASTDLAVHPNPRPGGRSYIVVAGGPFQCTYPESPHMWSSRTAELGVLQKIVSDYNRSGDPGQFRVLSVPDGNFDVVGVATRNEAGGIVPVKPLLDTLISIPSKPRTAHATLQAIADALRVKMLIFLGPPGGEGPAPPPNAQPPTVVVGGSSVPARDLLMDVADGGAGDLSYVWQLLYQPSPGPRYLLSVVPVYRAEYDMTGQRTLVPILRGQQ